jgi:hypothetical protein
MTHCHERKQSTERESRISEVRTIRGIFWNNCDILGKDSVGTGDKCYE